MVLPIRSCWWQMNIILIDQSNFYAQLLKDFIQSGRFSITHLATPLSELRTFKTEEDPVDLVLVRKDTSPIGYDQLVNAIQTSWPNAPVLVIGPFIGHQDILHAINSGIAGYFTTDKPVSSLLAAIDFVVSGEKYIPASAFRQAAVDENAFFSNRECQILLGVIIGKSNKEIGLEYNLAEVTVKLHVKNIMGKLKALNRGHAAAIALHHGLLPTHLFEEAVKHLKLPE